MKNHVTDSQYSEVFIEKTEKGRIPVLKQIKIPLLWPQGKALSVNKVEDLKEILKLVPQDAESFYAFLKSAEVQEFQEDIQGIGSSLHFEIVDA